MNLPKGQKNSLLGRQISLGIGYITKYFSMGVCPSFTTVVISLGGTGWVYVKVCILEDSKR